MQTYAQYCPISRALDVLGERWNLLIVRDLLVGSTRFNEIARGLPGLSRGLLSRRLRQLEAAGVVERRDGGYHLTEAGRELQPLLWGLAEWGAKHAFGPPRAEELDPDLLMWWMQGEVAADDVERRTVVEVHMPDVRRHYWLVLEPGDVSVCLTDPGYEVDAVLRGDLSSLYRMWLGETQLAAALRDGLVAFEGDRGTVRDVTRRLSFSPVAPVVRSVRAA
jgi:DNA-binding HxlR family transcriptional regulator